MSHHLLVGVLVNLARLQRRLPLPPLRKRMLLLVAGALHCAVVALMFLLLCLVSAAVRVQQLVNCGCHGSRAIAGEGE